MASPLNEAAVEGIELEAWMKQIPDLIGTFKTLYTKIKSAVKTYPTAYITASPGNIGATTGVAQRPAFRVPMRIQGGAPIQQGTGDGDSLGRGTGSQWISGDIQPVFVTAGCEITYLARRATDGGKRAMTSVRAQELKNSLESFMHGIEALFQRDGSGTLDTIPSTATVNNGTGTGVQTSSIVGLNNANQFVDQQVVQVFSSGGTNRGSFTISYVDGVSNTIYSSTALPTGTTTTDSLVISGSAGTSNSSIAGIRTYQVNGNSGTVLGISRGNYPSRLSTATINLSGAAVSPAVPFRAQILIDRALGPDTEEAESLIWYTGPGQQLQINNIYQPVVIANLQEVKGDHQLDMVKKYMPETFGGRELLIGYNQQPQYIDGLCLSTWGITELIEPSLYDFGNGVTTMPVPDPSGNGWLTSNIFYYNASLNLFNSNMRAGVYVQNAAEPTI
jgi:hypothetical protein